MAQDVRGTCGFSVPEAGHVDGKRSAPSMYIL